MALRLRGAHWGFERLHSASIPVDMLADLVDAAPNVVSVKAEGGFPSVAGCRRRC